MKAVIIDEFGGAEKMKYAEVLTPRPKAGEVQIEVKYAGVNPIDWKIREGWLKKRWQFLFPIVLGWDVSGVVSELGDGVDHLNIGDEVYALCRGSVVQWGTYAEFVCFDARHVVKKPENLSFAEAAGIPLVSLTSWQALNESGGLKEGETCLIHAGAGGAGGIGIQLAKLKKATIYTTASQKNHSYVKELGADYPINYNNEDFVKVVNEKEPDGVDLVYDCVGDSTYERSFDVVKKGGRIVTICRIFGDDYGEDKDIRKEFVLVEPDGKALSKISALFEEDKLKAPETEVFDIKDAKEALEKNRKGHTRGKLVLRVRD